MSTIEVMSPVGPCTVSERTLVLRFFVHQGGKLPQRGKPGDAGIDAYACLLAEGNPYSINVTQGDLVKIPLGISYAFYERDADWNFYPCNDYWLDVRNRSGVGTKSGMATVAEVGDANYRGVLHYCAAKITRGGYPIAHGDKIAQLLITPFVDPYKVEIVQVNSIEELGESQRGESGFGASGTV